MKTACAIVFTAGAIFWVLATTDRAFHFSGSLNTELDSSILHAMGMMVMAIGWRVFLDKGEDSTPSA